MPKRQPISSLVNSLKEKKISVQELFDQFHKVAKENRNDNIEKNNTTEDVLKNSPERAQNFFKVPKVVE